MITNVFIRRFLSRSCLYRARTSGQLSFFLYTACSLLLLVVKSISHWAKSALNPTFKNKIAQLYQHVNTQQSITVGFVVDADQLPGLLFIETAEAGPVGRRPCQNDFNINVFCMIQFAELCNEERAEWIIMLTSPSSGLASRASEWNKFCVRKLSMLFNSVKVATNVRKTSVPSAIEWVRKGSVQNRQS
jgi:hypothetical protein